MGGGCPPRPPKSVHHGCGALILCPVRLSVIFISETLTNNNEGFSVGIAQLPKNAYKMLTIIYLKGNDYKHIMLRILAQNICKKALLDLEGALLGFKEAICGTNAAVYLSMK